MISWDGNEVPSSVYETYSQTFFSDRNEREEVSGRSLVEQGKPLPDSGPHFSARWLLSDKW